jgi:ribosome-associated translation inhibitor RaiA
LHSWLQEVDDMEIHWVDAAVFAAAERENVEARIRVLADGHTDLIDVRIAARSSDHHRHGGQEVRITCEARGKAIVAARTRPDAGLALNEAMDVFEREVLRLRERRSERRVSASSRPAARSRPR